MTTSPHQLTPKSSTSSTMYIGTQPVISLYYGNIKVQRMYFGDTLVLTSEQNTGQAQTFTYTPSTDIFPNPERGFFQYTETHYRDDNSGHVPLNSTSLMASKNTNGRSLVFRYYVIEKYRTRNVIDAEYLGLIATDLAAARAAGVKLILRFTYSTSGTMTPPYAADTTPDRVVSHIGQLAPTLNQYADVIDSIQAGFIGMWGEWYYTDHFGDVGSLSEQNWLDRDRVLNALLDYLDDRIYILIRYPGIKERKFR